MFEKMEFQDGLVTNPSLADYKIPGMHDIPAVIENEAVEASERGGPFGAKGVGESGTFGVSPAIANAIEDAVGVRIISLPLTAETVYRALCAARGAPLEEQ
jgi:CO/xanthine dehydrogenase Mo-binding subunit